jgi:hypothetical protein
VKNCASKISEKKIREAKICGMKICETSRTPQ